MAGVATKTADDGETGTTRPKVKSALQPAFVVARTRDEVIIFFLQRFSVVPASVA
jgi:hypothetical protein